MVSGPVSVLAISGPELRFFRMVGLRFTGFGQNIQVILGCQNSCFLDPTCGRVACHLRIYGLKVRAFAQRGGFWVPTEISLFSQLILVYCKRLLQFLPDYGHFTTINAQNPYLYGRVVSRSPQWRFLRSLSTCWPEPAAGVGVSDKSRPFCA